MTEEEANEARRIYDLMERAKREGVIPGGPAYSARVIKEAIERATVHGGLA